MIPILKNESLVHVSMLFRQRSQISHGQVSRLPCAPFGRSHLRSGRWGPPQTIPRLPGCVSVQLTADCVAEPQEIAPEVDPQKRLLAWRKAFADRGVQVPADFQVSSGSTPTNGGLHVFARLVVVETGVVVATGDGVSPRFSQYGLELDVSNVSQD
jgi:hypothetical protein